MLEDAKLYYFPGDQVIMRTPKGDINITNNTFPHEKYSSMKEKSEETRYAQGKSLEGNGEF